MKEYGSKVYPFTIKKYFILLAAMWSLFIFLVVFWRVMHGQLSMAEITLRDGISHSMAWWISLLLVWCVGLFGLGIAARQILKRFHELFVISKQFAQREKESLRQKTRYEDMFNSITDAVVLVDTRQRIVWVNPSFTKLFGYVFEEVEGNTTEFLYISPHAYQEQCRIRYNEHADIVQSVYEIEYRLKEGTAVPTETMGMHVLDRHGDITGYLIVIRDITERKHVEQDTKNSFERSQGAEIAANMGSCIWDVNSGEISWSKNLHRIHDLRLGEFDGKIETVMGFIHPDDFDAVQHMIHKLFLDKRSQTLSYRIVTAAGVEKVIQSSTYLIIDDQGKVNKIIAMLQDVTLRKKEEEEKRINEERLNILLKLNEMDDVQTSEIIEFGLEGCVNLSRSRIGYFYLTSPDQVDLELFTWSSEAIRNCTADPVTKYPLEHAGIWADCIRAEKPVIHNDFASEPLRKGIPEGHNVIERHMSVPIFDDEQIVAVVGVANKEMPYDEFDTKQVTLLGQGIYRLVQRKKELETNEDFELQLQRAYKLEAINTLAEGIAHDFNNVLGIIFINADVALEDIPADNPAKVNLERIVKASTRAKDLVKQIMAYSSQADQKIVQLEPVQVVREAVRLYKLRAPDTVTIVENICTECGNIEADPAQLQQLFMNLFANTVYEMDGAGTLQLKGEAVELEAGEIEINNEIHPGTYFKLSISGTDKFSKEESNESTPDSNFVSRQQGDKASMGLSVARAIVRGNNGMISIDSQDGQGTSIDVYFPLFDPEEWLSGEEPDEHLCGTERILFIDDEALLAEMTAEMLKRKGYQVNVQADSSSALEVFKANPSGFDLVITDQTMANMTGTELAVEMMKITPDLPVILVSGYSKKISVEEVFELGIRDFLYKPFDTKSLLKIIRKVLENG